MDTTRGREAFVAIHTGWNGVIEGVRTTALLRVFAQDERAAALHFAAYGVSRTGGGVIRADFPSCSCSRATGSPPPRTTRAAPRRSPDSKSCGPPLRNRRDGDDRRAVLRGDRTGMPARSSSDVACPGRRRRAPVGGTSARRHVAQRDRPASSSPPSWRNASSAPAPRSGFQVCSAVQPLSSGSSSSG